MTCGRVLSELKAYLDGEVGGRMRWRVGAHLRRCDACAHSLSGLRQATQAMRALEPVTPPATFRAQLLARLPALTSPPTNLPGSRRLKKGAPRMLRIATLAVPLALATAIALTVGIRKQAPPQSNTRRLSVEFQDRSQDYYDERVKAPTSRFGPKSAGTDVERSGMSVMGGMGQMGHTSGGDQPPPPRSTKRPPNWSQNQGITSYRLPSRPDPLKALGSHSSPNLRIIRNADVMLKVKSFQSKWDQVAQIARSVGGFIAESNVDKDTDGDLSGSITVRVPEKFFESALERIATLGTLENKKVSSEDVSQEFVDTESRVRNLRSEEARLLALMDRAKRLSDILRIESELNRVRGDIEQATGRLRWLGSVTTYSTINVSMHEKVRKTPAPAGWTFRKEIKNAWLALLDALKVAATVLIWTVIYVPFYLILVGLGMVGLRKATHVWRPVVSA